MIGSSISKVPHVYLVKRNRSSKVQKLLWATSIYVNMFIAQEDSTVYRIVKYLNVVSLPMPLKWIKALVVFLYLHTDKAGSWRSVFHPD